MITSSVDGFYLNSSTANRFDPTPAEAPYKSHSLVDLLKKASPLFNARFTRLLNRKIISHPFESTDVPRPLHDWCTPVTPHTYDWNRSEDALLSTFGMDARGVMRDWNEEYQSCRDLARKSLQERIMRDRTSYRVYTDFVDAATKGAVAVIHGHIPPVNPMDPIRTHVFIYNNIFFSFAIDGRDQYVDIGGDRVTYANAGHDLRGIQALSEIDIPDVYTLATVVIDYRGHRIIAQSIIPGIFHGDRASKHVYGSMDQGVTIEAKPEFHTLMSKAAEKLHLAEHTVIDSTGKSSVLYACVDSKGIVGSDGRNYLLDLIRMTPRDANYPNYNTHPTALVRKELITLYCRKQAVDKLFVKKDADGKPVESENKDSDAEQASRVAQEEGADAPYIKLLASIRFNTDSLTNAKLGDDAETITSHETLLRQLSAFLLDEQIPNLITSLSSLETSPADGMTLTKLMHERGINVRYLGLIATRLATQKLPHLVHLTQSEMILRAAKHLLTHHLRQVEPDKSKKPETWFVASLISKFLSSLVGPHCCGYKISNEALESAKARLTEEKDSKKKRSTTDPLTPVNIWTSIRQFIHDKYQYEMPNLEWNQRDKLCMLRSLCLRMGIQLQCRDYDLSSTSTELTPITIDDILDLFPVVKSLAPMSRDAYDLLESGRAYLAQSRLNAAYTYLTEALSLHTQVYGPMHESTATCYTTLALTCYHASEYAQAVDFQQRAVIIYERVCGIDHVETAHAHMNLALFLHSIAHFDAAMTHAKRALFLFELIAGPNHPDTAAAHINVAMIYQDTGRVPIGLKHLHQALARNTACLGAEHTQVALSHHTIAIAYSLLGGFRLAMQHEKIAKTIYTNALGKQHPRVTQSVYWLNQFTAGAVKLAQTGQSTVPAQIARTSPLTWVSHRSTTPFKGRLTMNDVLQLFETAASRTVEHGDEEHVHLDDIEHDHEHEGDENGETEEPAATNGTAAVDTNAANAQKKRDKRRKQKAKAKGTTSK